MQERIPSTTNTPVYRTSTPVPGMTGIVEKSRQIQQDNGFCMKLNEVTLSNIRLIWANYVAQQEQALIVRPESDSIVAHFRFSGLSRTNGVKGWDIAEKQYGLFYQRARDYHHRLAPTPGKEGTIFEMEISTTLFDHFYTEESPFMAGFMEQVAGGKEAWGAYLAGIKPEMTALIQEMLLAPYTGHFKSLYLEAKVTELFLAQVKEFDQQARSGHARLKQQDIERLYEVKNYIELHYDTACSIIDLARKAGINQMKLKRGFKALFGTTVFGYLSHLRMQKAKQLLLDEKMYVNEVAEKIGYKHPHHFTVAFKKKFGILPSELKN
ncbi:helix-turn-helix transcriptional regulator [Chitinophaga japonensis]|uniref:AraC-like DNA-binding protein n=1 Tax=Chitinophaga japonensis TaxID=104662 RepID=A0A562T713_CHIJA|nr:AraC family transcriptional regulator [Chitinophaga japonensis]TWI89058.1 AraC-like DNA-binding protein [Chitinophaga japonensis]